MSKRLRNPVLRYDPSLEHNKENVFKNNSSKSKLKQNNRVAEKNLLKQLKDENLRLEAENKVLNNNDYNEALRSMMIEVKANCYILLPLLTESLWASFFVIMSLILVYNAYIFAEYLHDYFECSYWSNTYTLKCYVTKKVRYHLEDLNYNIVYTTLCALSLTGASILMRLQKYTKKFLMINE